MTPHKFLFIIPLTPSRFLDQGRRKLRDWCFNSLKAQSYSGWEALMIGEKSDEFNQEKRFIHVDFEGRKEEKLQIATRYIRENKLDHQYIIRLDDDDIFNPYLLDRLKTQNFDLYTDKYHHFIEQDSLRISHEIRPWYPNSCIHRMDHALTSFGKLAHDHIEILNEKIALIENGHHKIHTYYKGKNVKYAPKNNPVYLRVLNRGSITSNQSGNYESYLSDFGLWNVKIPNDFKDLISQPQKELNLKGTRSKLDLIKYLFFQLRLNLTYQKLMNN